MPPTKVSRAALAAALGATVGTIGAAAPADAAATRSDPDQVCWTDALTTEEIANGETSVVECSSDGGMARAGRSLDPIVAAHYDAAGGVGDHLYVRAPACSGYGISFTVNEWWNNRISSTQFVACGNVKHYVGPASTGDHQLISGGYGAVANLNATLNNQTSSIDYG